MPITLLHPDGESLKAAGVAITAVLTGSLNYVPALIVGNQSVEGKPVTFATGGGALGALSVDSDASGAPEGDTLGEWLEIDLKTPQGERRIVREIFDRVGYAQRQVTTVEPAAVAPVELVEAGEAAGTFLPLTAVWSHRGGERDGAGFVLRRGAAERRSARRFLAHRPHLSLRARRRQPVEDGDDRVPRLPRRTERDRLRDGEDGPTTEAVLLTNCRSLNFIDWCVNTVEVENEDGEITFGRRAQRYALIFSGHSLGFQDIGLFKDETTGKSMKMDEFYRVLRRVTDPAEMLGKKKTPMEWKANHKYCSANHSTSSVSTVASWECSKSVINSMTWPTC